MYWVVSALLDHTHEACAAGIASDPDMSNVVGAVETEILISRLFAKKPISIASNRNWTNSEFVIGFFKLQNTPLISENLHFQNEEPFRK